MPFNPCDICLEKTCGDHVCDCSTCPPERRIPCPKRRGLWPIVRVTTRCTQACAHCCFSCSPKCDVHMTPEMASQVALFLEANEIQQVTLMGGEIFCNPDWAEVVTTLLSAPTISYARIVTNGDWATTDDPDFLSVLDPFKEMLNIVISKDRWHTNTRVDAATAACERHGFRSTVTDEDQDNLENIVPAGRGELHSSLYSMMACYCQNPVNKYSFLIDEAGEIFKCGFGIWDYDSILHFTEGGFASRFKEFNRVFYSAFIPSCATCTRWSHRAKPRSRS